ncbi:SEC23-interacting protein-like isoform X2 [Ceratina calcarata]|uniref:SEC23-interacting protein-like isoform X2 n=1 Tax=Ceratina calcarata TaxID=156304 RepID=A0AAJ7IUQ1_9HYME|nr:SEC23-interacting protein-like isoform X2 [Ceratina calcarata]
MSGPSRKVRNPLLSAAGEGFPFENYTENTFLVPVTPATPAVLHDGAEAVNFVGPEPTNPHNSSGSATVPDVDSEFTPIPLHPEETKDPPSQLTKGYLTSILSSLPNLSLSSITGDSSNTQINQTSKQPVDVQSANPYVPSQDRDLLRDTSPPIISTNFHDPRRTNLIGSIDDSTGSTGSFAAPPPVPPTLPSSNNASVSYRLGNQRRLKYAPPPDITSNTPKQFSTPSQSILAPQSSALQSTTPLTIFNPAATTTIPSYQPVEAAISTSSPSIRSTPEYLSQANSLQESFRSSPVAAVPYSSSGTSGSATPQTQITSHETVHPVPERQSLSLNCSTQLLEPITPQNTPAVTAPYFGFDAQRDFLKKPVNPEKEATKTELNRSEPSISKETIKSSGEDKPTFSPVSAVQVSEKLEHLLAEQKETSLAQPIEGQKKTEENVKEDRTAVSLNDLKANAEEKDNSKSNALSNAGVEQLPERSFPQEVHAGHEKLDQVAQSHGFPSVQVPQQYQTFNFFADKPEQRSNLNYIPKTTLPEPSKPFVQSASSFFNAPESVSSFPYREYKESNARIDVGSDLQQVPLSSISSQPQSSWINNQTSESVSAACQSLPPPPLFYNLAQSDSVQYSSLSTPYDLNAYHHFGGSQTQDLTSSIGFLSAAPTMTTVPEPTGSATLNPVQMSVNPLAGRSTTDGMPPSFQNLVAGSSDRRTQYRGVYHHWFYRKKVEHKVLWLPFSMQDSLRLEDVYNSTEIAPETTVATDGGRYDVDILRRQRSPVYWSGESSEVRRSSWFFKGPTESRYVPYDENTATKLEEEYKQACLSNNWNRRIDLNNGEYIVFHSATVQFHYISAVSPEVAATWGNVAGSEGSAYLQGAGSRPKVIKRGLDEFHIEDGEPEKVDHLLFLVHGIGSVCDLKFRSVEEVVDEFRSISLQLVQSHYRTASEQRIVNRIEVLPVSWHTTLHSEDTGIDKKLNAITLDSIPKLRHFTNDTLLDILFYTSPVYCQTIMETVGNEINRLYALFKQRNSDFDGGIYLGGHSLGSLILFDLLCHQKPMPDEKSSENDTDSNDDHQEKADELQGEPVLKRRLSKKISYVVGAAGTGQPYIQYPQLHFHPRAFFALGSPIGMFVTVRGIDMLGEDFELPTCPAFFNIFHPFDPVAYRVEALINSDAPKYRPMLIPHHKGRKRMHLELKETMARVGADLKQRLLDSMRNTWNSVYQLAVFHKPDNTTLEREIDKVVEEQLQQTPPVVDQQNDDGGAEFKVGKLNGGRRIDYVLQEAPFEYINEYIFALTSHVCYWESEDTMLMILKEIYGSVGIQTDAQLPQQTLSIERVSPSPSLVSSSSKCDDRIPVATSVMGVDPTAPMSDKLIGPPPKSGFIKKS